MKPSLSVLIHGAVAAAAVVALTALAGAAPPSAPAAPPADHAPAVPDTLLIPRPLSSDPWRVDQLIGPDRLARELAETKGPRPFLVHVGFPLFYQGAHIPGSTFAGPGSQLEGSEALKRALEKVPRDREVVLYCGCCPWRDCPNVRTAFRTASGLKLTKLRVLYIPKNLAQDWIDRGFPVEKGGK